MKHIEKRGDTWYYRKRVPVSIMHLSTIKTLHKSLSKDREMAIKLVDKYNDLFNFL